MRLFYLKNRQGSILVIAYIMIVAFLILAGAFLLRSITEKGVAEREKKRTQAFYLAQAGVMRALYELRKDYNWSGTAAGQDVQLDLGTYQVSVTAAGQKRKIVASGFLPNSVSAAPLLRNIEVFVQKVALPGNFFDNALYPCGDVTFNGSAYEVNGNVTYAGSLNGDPINVTGDVTQDPTIYPLARFDFAQLRQISASQGNIYNALRLKTDFLPSSFWYDQAAGIPNIVYIEADMVLKGNFGKAAGFLLVVGDVITDPDSTQDTTINGNGEIDGCVYTTGEFRVNGGGNGINVNGGVWSGLESRLNGNVNITYNADYMDALESLTLSTDIQTISWREL